MSRSPPGPGSPARLPIEARPRGRSARTRRAGARTRACAVRAGRTTAGRRGRRAAALPFASSRSAATTARLSPSGSTGRASSGSTRRSATFERPRLGGGQVELRHRDRLEQLGEDAERELGLGLRRAGGERSEACGPRPDDRLLEQRGLAVAGAAPEHDRLIPLADRPKEPVDRRELRVASDERRHASPNRRPVPHQNLVAPPDVCPRRLPTVETSESTPRRCRAHDQHTCRAEDPHDQAAVALAVGAAVVVGAFGAGYAGLATRCVPLPRVRAQPLVTRSAPP